MNSFSEKKIQESGFFWLELWFHTWSFMVNKCYYLIVHENFYSKRFERKNPSKLEYNIFFVIFCHFSKICQFLKKYHILVCVRFLWLYKTEFINYKAYEWDFYRNNSQIAFIHPRNLSFNQLSCKKRWHIFCLLPKLKVKNIFFLLHQHSKRGENLMIYIIGMKYGKRPRQSWINRPDKMEISKCELFLAHPLHYLYSK